VESGTLRKFEKRSATKRGINGTGVYLQDEGNQYFKLSSLEDSARQARLHGVCSQARV
jgi:hypothetical protein